MYMERNTTFATAEEAASRIQEIDYQRAHWRAHELRAEAFRRTFKGLWRVLTGSAAAVWNRLERVRAQRQAEQELSSLSDNTLRDIAVSRSEIPYLARRSSPRG